MPRHAVRAIQPDESSKARSPSGPFAAHMNDAGLSPPTARTYRGFVACYLSGNPPDDLASMAAWLAAETEGRSDGAMKPRLAALRAWIAFRGGDPSLLTKPGGTRAATVARAPLSPADLAEYRTAVDGFALGTAAPAVRCALTLLPLTGLRVAEVCALRWADYVMRRVWRKGAHGAERPEVVPGFRVPADPGTRPALPPRFVPASEAARAALDEYRAFATPSPWMFPARVGVVENPAESLSPHALAGALRDLRPDGAWSADRLRRSYSPVPDLSANVRKV